MTARNGSTGSVKTAVDPELADWFLERLRTGRLPTVAFELTPGIMLTAPTLWYAWLAERIRHPQGLPFVLEVERGLRHLRSFLEGGP